MARETFTERLNRLADKAKLTEADIASILGMSSTQAGRLLDGTTKSLKLDQALKLCRRLGVSPWELAGEREPGAPAFSPLVEIPQDPLRLIAERVDMLSRILLRSLGDQVTAEEKGALQGGSPTLTLQRTRGDS